MVARLILLLACLLPISAAAQTAGPVQFGGSGQALTPYATVSYFGWLTPGAQMASDQTCAEEIARTTEGVPNNVGMNAAVPTNAQLNTFHNNPTSNAGNVLPPGDYNRIDGAYPNLLDATTPPTTDMNIRWAACKWGVDEDTLRAVEWSVSAWHGAAATGLATTSAGCTATNLSTIIYNNLLFLPGGASLQVANGCWTSYGINQIGALQYSTAMPEAMTSIPFSVDFAAAGIRGCINGDETTFFGASCTAPTGGHATCTTATGLDLYQGCTASRLDGLWWSAADVTYWTTPTTGLAALISTKPWPGGL